LLHVDGATGIEEEACPVHAKDVGYEPLGFGRGILDVVLPQPGLYPIDRFTNRHHGSLEQ
jgi:hypothetical protein